MKEVLNKSTVILLSFFAVAFSIFGSMTVMAGPTGTVDFDIEAFTEINFITDSMDFGVGHVNNGTGSAILQSNESGSVTGGSWATITTELVLQNVGTANVSLVLNSSANATDFIGGTSPLFKWMVTNSSGEDSCVAGNASTFEEVNVTTGSTVCDTFYWDDSKDSIDINFELTIPYDASVVTASSATITAIATEL